jgi:hypothetical protein
MNRLLLFVALTALSVLPASAQNSTTPSSPVIVKRLAVKGQTQALGNSFSPIAFFTPEHDGLYRVTFVIAQTNGALPCKCVEVSLIVANGAPLYDLAAFVEGGAAAVSAFPAVAGQPIGYYTALTTNALPSPYDLYIVIEEL